MPKQFSEFGGWLRFFQVIQIISFVLGIVGILLLLVVNITNFEFKSFIDSFVTTVDIIITMYFTLNIIKILKKREKCTPDKVVNNLKNIMLFSLAFLVIEIPLIFWVNDGAWTRYDSTSVRASLNTILHFVIWRSYFNKSKRVKGYYTNSEQELNNYSSLS